MPKDKLPEIESTPIKKESKSFEVTPDFKAKSLDAFFNYIINNELPAGVSKKSKIGKIEGVNSNVLKNEAVWFFQKGYTLEKLKEEIKPIYDRRNWPFNDLLGWFKKVEKGDIKEINTGELYNWCKVYAPELTRLLNLETSDIIELDFGDDDVHKDYALELINDNKDYWIVKQFSKDFDKYAYRQPFGALLSFHCLLGQIIKDVYIYKEKLNGSVSLSHPIDLRINLILMRPSGTGKSVGLDFVNNIVKGMDLTTRQPSDFTDAGLIGSIEKPDKFGQNITYGIFYDSDFITFDEAEILFEKSTHKEGALRRFNVALNTLGQASQKIYKRMRWGDIEYHPHFSTYFVSVPFFGFEEKIKSGFPQRHLINIEDEVINERLRSMKEDISRISFSTSPQKRDKIKEIGTQKYDYWKEIFDKLRTFAVETKFNQSDDIKNYIEKKIMPLYKVTGKIKSVEVQGIMFSFLARYLDHLYRLIFHSAIIRNSKTIEKIDVDYAYSIIKKTYTSILYYIEVNTRKSEDKLQDKVLQYIYSQLSSDKPKIRSGDLVTSIQNKFKKSPGTIFKILNEYVSKKLLIKEDDTKGGKERMVYYRRNWTK
jgi:hypothetical protein